MAFAPLNVLHVSTWNVACGIADYTRNLVRSTEAEGARCEILPLDGILAPWRLAEDHAGFVDRVVEAARDFDVVHVQHHTAFFSEDGYGVLLRALAAAGKRIVTTVHTAPVPEPVSAPPPPKKKKKTWRRWFGRREPCEPCVPVDPFSRWRRLAPYHEGHAAVARTISHCAAGRYTLVAAGLPAVGVEVVPHACPPTVRSSATSAEAKAALGLPTDGWLISVFGFLGPHKGQDLAIDALDELPEDCRLAIVGGMHPNGRGDYMKTLLEKAKRFKGRVAITGYVDEPTAARWFAATDVCLAPYRDTGEGASGAVTWPMAAGRPVVASKVEVFLSIQRQSECFFMVSPDVAPELGWAVEHLRRDEPLRRRLVQNSLRYCEEHSWRRTALKTIDVYHRLLGRATRNSAEAEPVLRAA